MTRKKRYCPRGHDAFQGGRRPGDNRCLACVREDAEAKAAAERARISEQHAAFQRRQVERDRAVEQEFHAAIARGGYDAVMARWNRASDETIEKTGSRYGLCQWEDEVDGEYMGRMCYRRTADVYCANHNRRLERETRKRAKERT